MKYPLSAENIYAPQKTLTFTIKGISLQTNKNLVESIRIIGGKIVENCFYLLPNSFPFSQTDLYFIRKLSICHKTLKEGNCFPFIRK